MKEVWIVWDQVVLVHQDAVEGSDLPCNTASSPCSPVEPESLALQGRSPSLTEETLTSLTAQTPAFEQGCIPHPHGDPCIRNVLRVTGEAEGQRGCH